jgi:hypothetical protein
VHVSQRSLPSRRPPRHNSIVDSIFGPTPHRSHLSHPRALFNPSYNSVSLPSHQRLSKRPWKGENCMPTSRKYWLLTVVSSAPARIPGLAQTQCAYAAAYLCRAATLWTR